MGNSQGSGESQQYSVWRPHPWHGLEVGRDPPHHVNAFIEVTPFDLMKYEVDKASGFMRLDRPQRNSSLPPTPYGFVPRTLSGPGVASIFGNGAEGDGDPLDICVVCERPISRAEIILDSRVIGGLQMLDQGQVDDKLIAVLANDPLWEKVTDLEALPSSIIDRLKHYFSTYKLDPGETRLARINKAYGAEHALGVIEAGVTDYQRAFSQAPPPQRQTRKRSGSG